jgi:major vault protein
VVLSDSALHLKAILDFEDDDKKTKRVAGDEWLFEGPGKYSIIDHLKADNLGTYIPRKEVIVEKTIAATIIRPNEALKLRARRETIDRDGSMRVTGEEWLVHKVPPLSIYKYVVVSISDRCLSSWRL